MQHQAAGLAEAMQRRREAVTGLGMLETLTARLVRMGGVALARTQAAAERGGGIGGFTASSASWSRAASWGWAPGWCWSAS